MDFGAAELVGRDLLVEHLLHDVGPCDEHVARPLGHEDEVGHGGGVYSAARRRPHDCRNLRHHARRQDVAPEYVGIAVEARDALLNPCPARIDEAYHRATRLERHVVGLDNLLGVDGAQRAAHHVEVLRVGVDLASANRAVARNDAVAHCRFRLAERRTSRRHECVELLERPLVEKHQYTLPGCQLATIVLLFVVLVVILLLQLLLASQEFVVCQSHQISLLLACRRAAAPVPPRPNSLTRQHSNPAFA